MSRGKTRLASVIDGTGRRVPLRLPREKRPVDHTRAGQHDIAQCEMDYEDFILEGTLGESFTLLHYDFGEIAFSQAWHRAVVQGFTSANSEHNARANARMRAAFHLICPLPSDARHEAPLTVDIHDGAVMDEKWFSRVLGEVVRKHIAYVGREKMSKMAPGLSFEDWMDRFRAFYSRLFEFTWREGWQRGEACGRALFAQRLAAQETASEQSIEDQALNMECGTLADFSHGLIWGFELPGTVLQ